MVKKVRKICPPNVTCLHVPVIPTKEKPACPNLTCDASNRRKEK